METLNPAERQLKEDHERITGNMLNMAFNYEREIKQLVDAMRYKLKKNAHKGRWEDLDLPKAIKLLKDEVTELEEAASRDSDIEIILEAADVANFALIVANLAMKRGANV